MSRNSLDTAEMEREGYLKKKDLERNDDSSDLKNEKSHEVPLLIKQKLLTGHSFFSSEVRPGILSMLKKTLIVNLVIGFFILGVFSIYWGSMFERNSRLKNLDMLLVVGDDGPIGNNFREFIETPFVAQFGNWKVYNESDFKVTPGRTVEEEIKVKIHHQKYWYSIYVKPEASINVANAIAVDDKTYNVSNNTMIAQYETGRDFISMNSFVTPPVGKVISRWLAVGSAETMNELANGTSSIVASQPLQPTLYDFAPYTNPVVAAPAQFGSIYMIILTFFQFQFFSEIYVAVAKLGLRPAHFLAYRYISTIFAFFLLSLFFSLVSLALQVDFTLAFGRGGFVVYWMVTFLTCVAVGLMNEIIGMVFIIVYPPMIGFWIIFWVVINVSPTFAALELSPGFFKFGYALPIFNSYEITKVILFNTWKGLIGRSIGILLTWCAVLSLLHPIMSMFFGISMMKKLLAAKAAERDAEAKEFESLSRTS